VDRHRLDADPDPTPSFTPFGKSIFILFYSQCLFTCFISLVSFIGVIIFNILDIVLNFLEKKYSLALHLVGVDMDPDLSI
jgi:hypothetical protein